MLPNLVKGNREFVSSNKYKVERKRVLEKQNPNALILSCSDSRNNSEIIFNEYNLGQLFTTRSAGHVLCESILDTIGYGIDTFDLKNIIV